MKKFILFILLVCAFSIASPSVAQDSAASPKCDLPTIQQAIDSNIADLQKLKTSTETNPVKLSDSLQQLVNNTDALRASCDGLLFSGKKRVLLGPITIPAGIYRAKATTTGYMSVKVTTVTGDCGAGESHSAERLFSLNKGEGVDGAETVLTSKDCTVLIEVSNVQTNWQLSFEQISAD